MRGGWKPWCSVQDWRHGVKEQVRAVQGTLRACGSNAQRLQLVDWLTAALATKIGQGQIATIGPSLFIYYSRYTVSSGAAAVAVTDMHDQYARAMGVIFETGGHSKTTLTMSPAAVATPQLQSVLQGRLSEGAPTITGVTIFLGFQEEVDTNLALATLRQIERSGAAYAVAMWRRTNVLLWTALARQICLERVHSAVQNMPPLTVTAPMAAARLTSLQGWWAQLVPLGR